MGDRLEVRDRLEVGAEKSLAVGVEDYDIVLLGTGFHPQKPVMAQSHVLLSVSAVCVVQ